MTGMRDEGLVCFVVFCLRGGSSGRYHWDGMGWDYALALSGAGLALVMIVEAGNKAGEASMLLPACYAIVISFA